MGENITTKGLRIRSIRTVRRAGRKITQLFVNERRRKARERLAKKSDINKGLTKAQRKAVETYENQIRNNELESAAAFGPDGKILSISTSGTKNNTALNHIPEHSVLTHNHPITSNGRRQATDVGVSLSNDDIATAIDNNAYSVRAVSGKYTYSLTRPSKGWNVDPITVYDEYELLFEQHKASLFAYRGARPKPGASKKEIDKYYTRHKRINSLASHMTTREIANRYGFIYTRKRTK